MAYSLFYPADFTFVCPTELEDLADNYKKFVKEGAEIMFLVQIRLSFIKLGTTIV